MRTTCLILFSILTLLASCNTETQEDTISPTPTFTTTIRPLTFILQEITGPTAEIHTLLPPAASPHTFEPRPSDLRTVNQSLLFVSVAPTLDGWAANLGDNTAIQIIDFVPDSAFLYSDHDHHHHGDGHDHHHHAGEANPHVWLDPVLVAELLPKLRDALCEADPQNCETYTTNADRFIAELEKLDATLSEQLAPIAGAKVVTFHPSFDYMFARYDIEIAAVLEPTPGSDPSPRYLQQIINLIETEGVKAIFSEPQLPPRSAEAVAEAAYMQLRMIDPLGVDATDYRELIQQNAAALVEALQ